jgi:hypothetical protein
MTAAWWRIRTATWRCMRLCDALLGAAGWVTSAGCFPDTDPQLGRARTAAACCAVVAALAAEGWRALNVGHHRDRAGAAARSAHGRHACAHRDRSRHRRSGSQREGDHHRAAWLHRSRRGPCGPRRRIARGRALSEQFLRSLAGPARRSRRGRRARPLARPPGTSSSRRSLVSRLAGAGEHLFLKLRETGCNTDWVAGQLARWGGRPRVDVATPASRTATPSPRNGSACASRAAGIRIPRRLDPGVELLECSPHDRKLKRGALRGNRFSIRVTALAADPEILEARLAAVAGRGVPNAFGAAAFRARWRQPAHRSRMVRRRPAPRRHGARLRAVGGALLALQRGAGRADLGGDWERVAAGDPVQLDGRGSWFLAEAGDAALAGRLDESGRFIPPGRCGAGASRPGPGPERRAGEGRRRALCALLARGPWRQRRPRAGTARTAAYACTTSPGSRAG